MKRALLGSLLVACKPTPLSETVLPKKDDVDIVDPPHQATETADSGSPHQVDSTHDLVISNVRENTAREIWLRSGDYQQDIHCFTLTAHSDFFIDEFHIADPYAPMMDSALYAFQVTWGEGEKFAEKELGEDNYGRFTEMNWLMAKGDEVDVCIHGYLREDLEYPQNFGSALMRIEGRGLESVNGLPVVSEPFTLSF